MTDKRFHAIPGEKGLYWDQDGYKCDLDWNPETQIEISRLKTYVVKKQREWDNIPSFEDDRITVTEDGEEIIDGTPRCLWCRQIIDEHHEDGICLSCLYKLCGSCGKTFKARGKSKTTCSSECAEILHAERGRWLILERDDFTCVYCGKSSPQDHTRLHVDHVVPVFAGGRSHAGNLITSCKPCNLEKSKRRMSKLNETQILLIAQERNKKRGIANSRVMRLREHKASYTT